MELFDLSHLHNVVAYIHAHPTTGGLITFAIAFLESVALIGGFIPGSVTMTAIGALIGSGAMPMLPTLLWAIFGAFVGDILSYGLGAYYNERLRVMWPFKKHPQWLTIGEDFFSKHGGKSVLIGRFFGPVRSLVPLVAGLLHMSVIRFALFDLIAAILWSLIYILPGVIVGALSLELPPATATKFILVVLALVAFGWIIFVLIHLGFKTMVKWADRAVDCIWVWLEQHKTLCWITKVLGDSNKANQHRQLLLAAFVVLCAVLFLYLFYAMIAYRPITHLNEPIFELLRSLRTRVGDDIMLAFTLFGSKYVQLSCGVLIFIWLLWKRYHRAAWHWLAVIFLATGIARAVKLFYYSPRPVGVLHPQLTSSFPSGHTVLTTAFLVFLAMLVAHHTSSERRKTPFLIAGFFIIGVALSRIYLGAHWLTDVLASLALGLGCAAVVNLSYLRSDSKPLPVAAFSKISVGIFLIMGLCYSVMEFHKQQEDYTLYWPTVTIDTETWWRQRHPEEPFFILSRLGKPESVLNVQWLGSLNNIRHMLTAAGWQEQPIRLNWKGSLNRLSPTANPQHLPVWPTLYQNRSPVLLMTKQKEGKPSLHFVLWQSNITLSGSNQKLWIGSVHYFIPRPQKNALSFTSEQTHALYKDAMQVFKESLQGVVSRVWVIPVRDQPSVMAPLDWDGKLLLIKNKGKDL